MASAPVVRLSDRVVRVMGLNPGPMTLTGTCTYLVGKGSSRILVDTGEGIAQYGTLLAETLRPEGGLTPSVRDVVLTHWHQDHVGGVAQVQQLFPNANVYKFPSRYVPSVASTALSDLQELSVDDGDTTLRVTHTPGHTDDHVCLQLVEENAVFTGDCVLGTGSSVFASYGDFMASLERIHSLKPNRLYPGHGPVVDEPLTYLEKYATHRRNREHAIERAVVTSEIPISLGELLDVVYGDIAQDLHDAASQNIFNTLKDLHARGRVSVQSTSGEPLNAFVESFDEYAGALGAEGTASIDRKILSTMWHSPRHTSQL